MGFAETAFAFYNAQNEFESQLSEVVGDWKENELDWNRIGWDPYDFSIEFESVRPAARLSLAAQQFIFAEGFEKIYVKHTDEWEDHYSKHGGPTLTPWRRKRREGGFDINFMPCGWGEQGQQWVDGGYMRLVPDDKSANQA